MSNGRGRPKKIYTPEDRLESIKKELSDISIRIKELEQQKKEVEQTIRLQRLEDLNSLLTQSGLTISDVENLIRDNSKNPNTSEIADT